MEGPTWRRRACLEQGPGRARSIGRRSAIVEGRPKAAAVTAKPVLHPRRPSRRMAELPQLRAPTHSPRQAAHRRGPGTPARLRPVPVSRPRLASSSATPAVQRPAHLAPTRWQAHGRTLAPRAGSPPAPVAHRPARLETENWRSRRSRPDQVPRLARPQPFRTRWSLGTAPPSPRVLRRGVAVAILVKLADLSALEHPKRILGQHRKR